MSQVTDNADLIFMRDALDLVLLKLAKVVHNLSQFAFKYKDLPTLGFTYVLQPKLLLKISCTLTYVKALSSSPAHHCRASSSSMAAGARL